MLDRRWAGAVVSEGTPRTEDLIPKFCAVLAEVEPIRAQKLLDKWETLTPDELADGQDSWLLEDLFDALGGIAPKGTYFSASEGDGACFGFWTIKEEKC